MKRVVVIGYAADVSTTPGGHVLIALDNPARVVLFHKANRELAGEARKVRKGNLVSILAVASTIGGDLLVGLAVDRSGARVRVRTNA